MSSTPVTPDPTPVTVAIQQPDHTVKIQFAPQTNMDEVNRLSQKVHDATAPARLIRNSEGDITGLDTHGYTTDVDQPAVVSIPHPDHQITAAFAPGTATDVVNRTSKAIFDAANTAADSAREFSKGLYSSTVGGLSDLAHQYWTTTTTPAKNWGDNFVNDLATAIVTGHINEATNAAKAWKDGHYSEAAGHALAAATPLVGPAAARTGEKIGQGKIAEGLGETAGLLGTVAGGSALKALKGTPASEAAEAAETAEATKPVPVPLSDVDRTAEAFLRRQRLSPANRVEVIPDKTAPASNVAGDAERYLSKLESEQTSHVYSKTEGNLLKAHRVDTYSPTNEKLGYVSAIEDATDPNVWRVEAADMGKNAGKGLGTAAYTKLADEAAKQGATLRSGSVVSDSAANTWRALKRAGLNVVEQETPEGSTFEIPAESSSQPLVGPAPVKPSLRALLASERGELTIPGTSPEPPNVPTFYSKAEQVATEKVPNSASGSQILATLRNNGVKENEIGWMGLDDYLQGKPKVSKSDLQQFINENQIQLKEVDLGYSDRTRQLAKQRDEAYVENNNLWHDFKGQESTYDLFNAMNEGRDVEPIIAKFPESLQQKARRFVETDKMIHDLDAELVRVNQNRMPTKFETYTLPGEKSNYTEKLLILPDKTSSQMEALNSRLSEMANRPSAEHAAHPEWKDEWDDIHRQRNALLAQPQFRGGHFDQPNVLAHVRYDERPTVDGKKTLFLDEIQSDWHQQGKKSGYQTVAPTPDDIDLKFVQSKVPEGHDASNYPGYWESFDKRDGEMITRHPGTMNQTQAMKDALAFGKIKSEQGVPQAPFASDWHELVMKRMLRHAAENGYDSLSWTTGNQQAARYDLSKHVDEIHYNPETQRLTADKDGSRILDKQLVKPEQLADYVGKEPAQKLMAAESNDNGLRSLKGDDLKVGGTWANALYDRAIPNFLKSYAKRWGAKVGTTTLHTGTTEDRIFTFPENGTVRTVTNDLRTINGTASGTLRTSSGNVLRALEDGMSMDEAMDSYGTQELVDAVGGKMKYGKPRHVAVHSIEINKKMRDSVLKQGQPIAMNKMPAFDWQKAVMNG